MEPTYVLSTHRSSGETKLFKFLNNQAFFYEKHNWRPTSFYKSLDAFFKALPLYYHDRIISEQEVLEFLTKLKLQEL